MEINYANIQESKGDTEDFLNLIGFRIDKEVFGVDILFVQEIIKEITITPIPDSPEFIKGIINLRGSIVPVIDLKKRLKLKIKSSEEDRSKWIIVLSINNRITGFVVDSVTKVLKVQSSIVQPAPELSVTGIKSDYIKGVCKYEDHGLLAILDFNKILVVEEFKRAITEKRKTI